MNKFLKIIVFFVLISFLNACSYKPIFLKKSYDFKIKEINLVGDKDINSIINRKLKFIKTDDGNYKKIYTVDLNTKKERRVISKDTQGDPEKFEISITTKYKIYNNQKLLVERKIKQKNIYNNETDKFKLEKSEKIIIQNLTEKISENIITSIINLNDN